MEKLGQSEIDTLLPSGVLQTILPFALLLSRTGADGEVDQGLRAGRRWQLLWDDWFHRPCSHSGWSEQYRCPREP